MSASCEHARIIAVELQEYYIKGKKRYLVPIKTFFECEDCGMMLPIKRITKEIREVKINPNKYEYEN